VRLVTALSANCTAANGTGRLFDGTLRSPYANQNRTGTASERNLRRHSAGRASARFYRQKIHYDTNTAADCFSTLRVIFANICATAHREIVIIETAIRIADDSRVDVTFLIFHIFFPSLFLPFLFPLLLFRRKGAR